MKYVTIHIGGVEKSYVKIHYVKSHPSPDPDTFEITLTPEEVSGMVNFSTVEIKKDGVTEFYGFVEEITPQVGEDGLEYLVTGRCWKVILWKKYTERYQESREVGPMDTEGNIETGFFGSVDAEELIKFIMRCPISIHPKGYIRHKIGWGIPSDDWACCASDTADCYYPDWVILRYTGLAWRIRGGSDDLTWDELHVDTYDGTYCEYPWQTVGVSPYLDTIDINNFIGNIMGITCVDKICGDFTFENIATTTDTVYSATLHVYHRKIAGGADVPVRIYMHDGTSWYYVGEVDYPAPYGWMSCEFNVITILNTLSKVNAAKVRFYMDVNDTWGGQEVTYVYLTIGHGDFRQSTNDWFAVNLNDLYDDVVGILVECRNNPELYARNYKIQYASLSGCCGLGESDWNDFDPPVNVTNNTTRDLLHSWKPQDDVHCIRIKLTESANSTWEISQIYIWQADEPQYRVLDE